MDGRGSSGESRWRICFGNLQDAYPRVDALGGLFAWSAVGTTAIGGFVAAHRTRSISAALRVGLWSGLISGAITFATLASVVVLFHDAMVRDPSNIREFALSVHRQPSEAELSRFSYTDGLAGGVNHLWIGPLLGITVGGIGAVLGKFWGSYDGARKNLVHE